MCIPAYIFAHAKTLPILGDSHFSITQKDLQAMRILLLVDHMQRVRAVHPGHHKEVFTSSTPSNGNPQVQLHMLTPLFIKKGVPAAPLPA